MAPRIELYAFRYRDPIGGKWIRARYVATLEEIARRYQHFEILGPAQIRDVDPESRHFAPHRQVIGNLGQVFAFASSSRSVPVAGIASRPI